MFQENDELTLLPNVEIEFLLYLSIMATNAEGERSFSKLTKIKDAYQLTVTRQG